MSKRVIVSVEPINDLTRGGIGEIEIPCKYPERVKERVLKAVKAVKEEVLAEEQS